MSRTRPFFLIAVATATLVACEPSGDSSAKTEEQTKEAAAKAEAEKKAAAAREAEKAAAEKKAAEQKRIERSKKTLAKFEKANETELARWTPKMRKKAAKLANKRHKKLGKALKTILRGDHRVPGHADRDAYRHPLETMKFFGVAPTSKIVEFGAGAGWYTELLAPLVAQRGSYTVVSGDPNGPLSVGGTPYAKRVQMFLKKSPEIFGKVSVQILDPKAPKLGAPGSADVVLAIREMHNWHAAGALEQNLAAAFEVLAPGGVLGVVQHRAAEGADPKKSAGRGRLPEQFLIDTAKKAGFELAARSDVNNNPKDEKNYKEGVWTLPPTFALKDVDRERYAAIGESDRMTLRFVKPAT